MKLRENEILVAFGDIPVGARCRLENFIGEKVEPIVCDGSRKFYAESNSPFWDWNFHYQFCGFGELNYCSVGPSQFVAVLAKGGA